MNTPLRCLIVCVALVLVSGAMAFATIPWPMAPFNQQKPIGNSYGEYQNYGGAPYLHPGIDVMQPAGTPVYAVKSGYVKAVLTTAAELHWRVAIGDSAGTGPCDGWLYAHLDQPTIQVSPGQYVSQGTWLGDLVLWPIADFNHCHFVKIRQSGFPWTSDWAFIANPMDELINVVDTNPPFFVPVGEDEFAFTPNNTHTYFAPGATLSGAVDIVARIQDRVMHPTWQVTPDQVTYEIRNDTLTTGEIVSFVFTGVLDYTSNVNVIYQNDATYNTRGDYSARVYYFIVTNTDGDSVVDAADVNGAWQTQNFNNGNWWVKVRAYDHGGNITADSMQVAIANYFSVNGTVGLCDGAPDSSGTKVTAPDLPGSPSVTTDGRGRFTLNNAVLGKNRLSITRPGYAPLDTVIVAPAGGPWSRTLTTSYLVGDVVPDSVYNVLDVVRLIEVVFRGSVQPFVPYWAGDLDFNRKFDVIDVVLLIGHVFRGEPPPSPPRCFP